MEVISIVAMVISILTNENFRNYTFERKEEAESFKKEYCENPKMDKERVVEISVEDLKNISKQIDDIKRILHY